LSHTEEIKKIYDEVEIQMQTEKLKQTQQVGPPEEEEEEEEEEKLSGWVVFCGSNLCTSWGFLPKKIIERLIYSYIDFFRNTQSLIRKS